jgi:anti-sigma factor RsiW
VSDKKCPGEAVLTSFADNDLSPEQLKRVERHLELCSACTKQVLALEELLGDIAAPVEASGFDVSAHVGAVMQRLDTPARVPQPSRLARWGVALAAAAAIGLLLFAHREGGLSGEFRARGSTAGASLSRDVGVQLYAKAGTLRRLESGDRIRADVALTAGLRNLSQTRAHLLLFAVDARGAVHWIAPEFTVPGSNPQAAVIDSSDSERLLPSAAVFDDLAPGPLRIAAVIAREPMRVLEVDALSGAELATERLMARFPRAEIRQFQLEVEP